MKKVIVLGHKGMLGSTVSNYLSKSNIEVIIFDNIRINTRTDINAICDMINRTESDYIINCIGKIKPKINKNNIDETIVVNSLFPIKLAKLSKAPIIQIATDCVYSGKDNIKIEDTKHDPNDIYGMSKSLGENCKAIQLRCSIIGPEKGEGYSLLNWVLKQENYINGYINHKWNGITTLAFAKICVGIIYSGYEYIKMQHIVPADAVSKWKLINLICNIYGKTNKIIPIEAEESINRILDTEYSDINRQLWILAGYKLIPTIEEMIKELKEYGS